MPKARPVQYCGVIGCGKTFDRPAKLRDHLRTHTGETPFKCSTCFKPFSQRKHCQVHELSHLTANDRPFICPHCQKGLISNQHYQRHLKSHERAQLQCPHCPRQFTQQKSYDTHVNRHVRCPECDIMCKNDNHLRRHTQKQHNYFCKDCRRIFDTNPELEEHLKVSHKKIGNIQPTLSLLIGNDYLSRPLECTYKCGKRFTREYDLERHLKSDHPN